jgi:WD40 repeat protein
MKLINSFTSIFALASLFVFAIQANAAPDAGAPSAASTLVVEAGHRAEVNQIVFSSDGKFFASASNDRTIVLHDAQDGAWKKTLRNQSAINCLAFAPISTWLAGGDADNAVTIWNTQSGALVRTCREEGTSESERKNGVLRVAWSPDGKVIAAASSGGAVRLWNAADGMLIKRVATSMETISLLQFSSDSQTLFAGNGKDAVRAWSTPSGEERALFNEENTPGVALAFSPDGKRIAFRADGGKIVVWDAVANKSIASIAPPRAVSALAFSPDGKTLIGVLALNLLAAWNEKGEIFQAWETGQEMLSVAIASLALAPDGKAVVMANKTGTIKLWDMASGKLRARLPAFRLRATQVLGGKIKDSPIILGAYDDGSIFVWDGASGKLNKTLRNTGRTIACAALSRDGSTLAFALGWQEYSHTMETQGVPYQEIQLWDTNTWTLQRAIKLIGYQMGTSSLTFSPDGALLAGGTKAIGFDNVRLWDTKTGEEKSQLEQQGRLHPDAIAFSPDGTLFASSNDSGMGLQLWETATQTPLLDNRNGSSFNAAGVVFLSNDRVAATGNYGLRVFDAAAKKWLPNIEKVSEAVNALAVSPDASTLANATQGGEVKLWDVATWKFKGYLPEEKLGATDIAFLPDGKKLVTDSAEGSLKVWDAGDGHLIATLQILPNIHMDGDSTEWITWTPRGVYTGSPNAAKFVHLASGQNATPTEIETKYSRPDDVKKALNGGG